MSSHQYVTPRNTSSLAEEIDTEEDPEVLMIKRTGCLEQHYDVLDCMFEKKDWRKCQDILHTFKNCMNKSKEQ